MEWRLFLEEYSVMPCSVYDEDNAFLFAGVLRSVEPYRDRVRITPKGGACPLGMYCGTKLKIKVLIPEKTEEILFFLMGCVIQVTRSDWIVCVENFLSGHERRENFRQKITGSAKVRQAKWNDTAANSSACSLMDISMGGICFRCRALFEEKSRIVVEDVRLMKDSGPYTFECTIRRIRQWEKDGTYYVYGCSFDGLTQEQNARLSRDILALQANEIRNWRRN